MNNSWERWPDEPARWYDRFWVYCNLGPNRTLSAAYRQVAQRDGLKTQTLPQHWREQARRWAWAARAAAWDAAREAGHRLPSATHTVAPTVSDAASQRRSMVEQLLAIVFAVLVQADLDGMSSAEARRALPTLRLFFKDLLAAHRLEMGEGAAGAADVPPFTADELRAAQEHLAAWQASWPTRSPRAPPVRLSPGASWLPLRDVLAQLYPDEAGARRVAAQGGLASSQIAFGPRAVDSWHAILTEAIHAGRLASVVAVALREYGSHPGLHAALAAYQAGTGRSQ